MVPSVRLRFMNTWLFSLPAAMVVLAVLAAPNLDNADCGSVADRYTGAVSHVADALAAYQRCVSHSNQREDCAAEMQALDDAHDAFADAVADAKECR